MNSKIPRDSDELSFDHFQIGFPEESVPDVEPLAKAIVARSSEAASDALAFRRPQSTSPSRMADGKFRLTTAERTNITPATAVVLMNYPRVLERFQAAWGKHDEFQILIREVGFMDAKRFVNTTTSLAGRKGFPAEALEEINELIATHDARFGKFLSLVEK
jgi:hypothetical protein